MIETKTKVIQETVSKMYGFLKPFLPDGVVGLKFPVDVSVIKLRIKDLTL